MNSLRSVFPQWLASRLVVALAMFGLAPLLRAPHPGIQPPLSWEILTWWDSLNFIAIAEHGYNYGLDGQEHTIAFFPLYPLGIWLLGQLGLPAWLGGALINNLAFLGALTVLHGWLRERYSETLARWSCGFLTWCPYGVFTTVVYSEGLYLLVSTLALRAFDQGRYSWAALWGALASAARPTGLALVPALLTVAWRQKLGWPAYLSGLGTSLGVVLFSLYCQVHFGDYLAFVHAQTPWRSTLGIDWLGWVRLGAEASLGEKTWQLYLQENPLHLPLGGLLALGLYALGRCHRRLPHVTHQGLGLLLGLGVWLWGSDPLIQLTMVFGSGVLLWRSRREVPGVVVAYGYWALALVLAAGHPVSVGRFSYGVVSCSLAFGWWLGRHRFWGRPALLGLGLVLALFGLRFAEHRFIG